MLHDARPDVVLLDLRLPDATGAEAVIRLREADATLPIVAFSVDRTPALVRAVLRAGASGYVTKDAPISRLVAALHAVPPRDSSRWDPMRRSQPRPHFPAEQPRSEPAGPNGDDRLVHAAPEPAASTAGEVAHENLTPRELELLRYMAEGYTNKELARAMVLAEDTVKKAVQTLIAKLGAADRTHAVVIALRTHLID